MRILYIRIWQAPGHPNIEHAEALLIKHRSIDDRARSNSVVLGGALTPHNLYIYSLLSDTILKKPSKIPTPTRTKPIINNAYTTDERISIYNIVDEISTDNRPINIVLLLLSNIHFPEIDRTHGGRANCLRVRNDNLDVMVFHISINIFLEIQMFPICFLRPLSLAASSAAFSASATSGGMYFSSCFASTSSATNRPPESKLPIATIP